MICYDVLQYLPARRQARRAIANLARLCRGALYFGALTREDWRENCDQTRTDRIPGLRLGGWYRRELARAFRPIGCGMWLKRDLPRDALEPGRGAHECAAARARADRARGRGAMQLQHAVP